MPSIFREKALAKIASPEQLDQLMRVTTPGGWLTLAGIGLLLVFSLLWSIFGSLTTNVVGQGILLRHSGVQTVMSTNAGQVTEVLVQAGDVLTTGQAIARILPNEGRDNVTLISPMSGRVVALLTTQGDLTERGRPLLTLEAPDEPLDAILFLPLAEGKSIHPGMEALVSPSTAERNLYGYLIGRVDTVSEFPIDAPGLARRVGNDALAQTFLQQGALIEVRVTLIPSPDTLSGYLWSSRLGPPLTLTSGTLCNASIVVRRQMPLSLIFSFLGDK